MFPQKIVARERVEPKVQCAPSKKLLLVKEKLATNSEDPYSFRPDAGLDRFPMGEQPPSPIEAVHTSKTRLLAETDVPFEGFGKDAAMQSVTPKGQSNRAWFASNDYNQSTTRSSKIFPGVSTDNYFSLISLIRQEAQRLIDEFGLPAADIHRMVTYKQLFEWLLHMLRQLLESRTNRDRSRSRSPLLEGSTTQRRRVSPEKQLLKKECRLLKETNRLLLQSEAAAKLKLTEVKNEWRVACEKMKTLHGIMNDREVSTTSSRHKGMKRNLSFVEPNNSTVNESPQFNTSRSQIGLAQRNSQHTHKVEELCQQIDHLTVLLAKRDRRIADLQAQLVLKQKEVRCLEKEFGLLMEKVKLVEGFKSERATLYEHELLQQIRRVSGEPRFFGRKETRRVNITEGGSSRQSGPTPHNTRRQPVGESRQLPPSPPKKPEEMLLVPRLTFNARQLSTDIIPKQQETLPTQPE